MQNKSTGIALSALGIGCSLLLTASTHLPMLQSPSTVTRESCTPDTIAATLALGILALYAFRPQTRCKLASSAFGLVCAGLLGALAAFGRFVVPVWLPEMETPAVMLAARTGVRLSFLLLTLAWAETLAGTGVSKEPTVLRVVFHALLGCGIAEALAVFVIPKYACATTVLLAPVSVGSIPFARSRLAFGQTPETGTPPSPMTDTEPVSRRRIWETLSSPLTMLFTMSVLLLANYSWYLEADSSYDPMLVQLSSGLGVVAGGFLYHACYRWWRRGRVRELAVCGLIAVATTGLYLTTLLGAQLAFVYVLLLKVGESLCIFLALPRGDDTPATAMTNTAACLLAYQLARCATMGAQVWMPADLVSLLTPSMVIAALAVLALKAVIPTSGASADLQASLPQTTPDPTVLDGAGLTERERQIARMLLEGRTSTYIANSVGLANSTVRNYTSSIYAKLGIHSRQDLLDLAHHLL